MSVGLVQRIGIQGSCYSSLYGRELRLRVPLEWEKMGDVMRVAQWGRQSRRPWPAVRAVSSPSVWCERSRSLYEVLGIPEGGSVGEIKNAYKQMARKYHPDVSPPALAEENAGVFIRVQEAYETLSDPTKRALYDHQLAGGLHLAFSARKMQEQDLGDRNRWRRQWQSQIAELKRKSVEKRCKRNLSWGARMRRRRKEASAE